MGRKSKRPASEVVIEEEVEEISCFYCLREFKDVKALIVHQNGKHFKCPTCHKACSTLGALKTHCSDVHKEVITKVPGAAEGRTDFKNEVYGMTGIPEEFMSESQKSKIARHNNMNSNAQPLGIGNYVASDSIQQQQQYHQQHQQYYQQQMFPGNMPVMAPVNVYGGYQGRAAGRQRPACVQQGYGNAAAFSSAPPPPPGPPPQGSLSNGSSSPVVHSNSNLNQIMETTTPAEPAHVPAANDAPTNGIDLGVENFLQNITSNLATQNENNMTNTKEDIPNKIVTHDSLVVTVVVSHGENTEVKEEKIVTDDDVVAGNSTSISKNDTKCAHSEEPIRSRNSRFSSKQSSEEQHTVGSTPALPPQVVNFNTNNNVAPSIPSGPRMLWTDETYSMEEKRAQLLNLL